MNDAVGPDAALHVRFMNARLQVFPPLTDRIGNESDMCCAGSLAHPFAKSMLFSERMCQGASTAPFA